MFNKYKIMWKKKKKKIMCHFYPELDAVKYI